MNVAVVGSGISGIFAAHALVSRGLSVTILDVGETLDESRQMAVDKLHDLLPEHWPHAAYDLIRKNNTFHKGVLPKKVHFGSDYIYADDRAFAPIKVIAQGRIPYPTFAKGGFSNIWGAAVLPPAECDMSDWPIPRSQLEPYFRKVAQILPLCGGEGTLSDVFPAYRDRLGDLDAGPQGEALLEDLRRVQARLRKRMTLYGKARLAVHTDSAGDVLACIGCGHCFTGCVRGSIFSTLPMLNELIRTRRVNYRPGFYVNKVEEHDGKPALHVVDIGSNEGQAIKFDAIFLAAGPINTSRLLMLSRQLYDRPVRLKESQKFVLPILRLRGALTAIEHPSVTLASTFIEVKVPSQSAHWLHLQIVPMNQMIVDAAGLGRIQHPLGKRLWKPLSNHMMAAWCSMHSDYSSHL
jgi:choline dehydrogenase-like flavoprotein